MDGLERGPKFGLWWRVFSDDDTFSLWPRETATTTFVLLVPLVALLFIVAPESHAYLTIPYLCAMLHVFATYLMGTFGCVVTGPVLVFGIGTLGWVMGVTGFAVREGTAFALAGHVLMIYLAFTFFLSLRSLWKERRVDLFALMVMGAIVGMAGFYYGSQAASGYIGIGFVQLAKAVDTSTVIGVFNGIFIAVLIVCAGLVAVYLRRLAESVAGTTFVRRKVIFEVVGLMLGVVPMALALLAPGLNALLLVVVFAGSYVAYAFLAGYFGVRVEAWTLVAWLLLASVGIACSANVDFTLPCVGFRYTYLFCATNKVMVALSDAAQMGLQALAAPSVNAVRGTLAASGALEAASMPDDLVWTLALYPTLLFVASLMGVASYLGEVLKKRRGYGVVR